MKEFLIRLIQLAINRIFLISFFIAAIFIALLSVLLRIQVRDQSHYEEIAQSAASKTRYTMPAATARGNIYDRNGHPLAVREKAAGETVFIEKDDVR